MTATQYRTDIRMSSTSAGHTVEVYGPLTWRDVPAFRSAVSDHRGAMHVLIDLTGATSIDSAGAGALIASYLEADGEGIPIAVLAIGDIANVIERIGLAGVLPVFADRRDSDVWLTE
jgi:anti-anti-sigma regulatory factor